jgi:UDP-N-acetylmuramyl pentapeptide synthase
MPCAGAVAAVVATDRAEGVGQALREGGPRVPETAILIEVDDTVAALGRLAAYHRHQIAADVIAVVGSNGKTTTKAMIHHILPVGCTGAARRRATTTRSACR